MTIELDDDLNPIVDENGGDEVETDDTDYKSLYEQEKAEKERISQEKEKFEWRFKKTANELNQIKKGSQENGNVAEMVSKQVAEEMYYANNPVAKEFQKEIKEIQAKTSMSPEDAMTFYLAKNKPELIQKKSETWVDWVSKPIESKKDPKDMSYEELRWPEKKRGV